MNVYYNVYHCSSCHAELLSQSLQDSVVCPVCGCSTMSFRNTVMPETPDAVLPFKVTREQAVKALKDVAAKASFAPDGLNDINVDNVKGVYVPFYAFDIDYRNTMKLYGVRGKDTTYSMYFLRQADCTYTNILYDASSLFDDSVSDALNNWKLNKHLDSLKPFDNDLVGDYFLAPADVPVDKVLPHVIDKAEDMFYHEMVKSCTQQWDRQVRSISIVKEFPEHSVIAVRRILLPVWYLNCPCGDRHLTFVINGFTKKIAGSIPISRRKVLAKALPKFLIFFIPALPVYYLLLLFNIPGLLFALFPLVICAMLWYGAVECYQNIRKAEKMMKSDVSDRTNQ
ncbi:MAG: hypothetical protein II951_11615 [Bacteroidales bacterium]|nr:hypothetical protein [Bacteroidales bacterium]